MCPVVWYVVLWTSISATRDKQCMTGIVTISSRCVWCFKPWYFIHHSVDAFPRITLCIGYVPYSLSGVLRTPSSSVPLDTAGPTNRGTYYTRLTFPHPGTWNSTSLLLFPLGCSMRSNFSLGCKYVVAVPPRGRVVFEVILSRCWSRGVQG